MILVGGENLIDFVQDPNSDGLPRYVANPGGSPYNVAMALGRQEVPVGYLTPISTDSLGDLLAARLIADGVELLAPRASQPSSLAVVSLQDGTPSYGFYRENTAERQISAGSVTAPAATTGLHLGSLALANGADAVVWEDFFHAQKGMGRFTSLDPNVRAAFIDDRTGYVARIERMAAAADLVKLSDEDLEWLYPHLGQDAAVAHVHALNPTGLTVLTKGADGARALSQTGSAEVAAGQADPFTDTVGAGDTFAGTLLAQLFHSNRLSADHVAQIDSAGLVDLLTGAARASAINCSRQGCQPPTRADLA
ncbi:MAG: carbohydrate kinase [Paracoccaceae bacterium]